MGWLDKLKALINIEINAPIITINNPKGTKSFDLIYNGVEISSGAQREHRLEILEKQCKEKEW